MEGERSSWRRPSATAATTRSWSASASCGKSGSVSSLRATSSLRGSAPEPAIPFQFLLQNSITLRFFLVYMMPAELRTRATADITRMLEAGTLIHNVAQTFALDDIDWDDEVRVFLEERTSFSPDGLTGMEANLRFVGPETMESKIFSRLTAWQNWIFQRPNAVGEEGALRRYGTGQKAQFDMTRV